MYFANPLSVDFWSQDTGETETAVNGLSSQGPVIMVDPEDPGALGSGREIKELVQDEV